jgi:hypothetical protein
MIKPLSIDLACVPVIGVVPGLVMSENDHFEPIARANRLRATGACSICWIAPVRRRSPRRKKARYLIGLAVTRQIEYAPRDPDTVAEIAAVCRWIEHWLTPDELIAVMEETGLIFDHDLADELSGPESFPHKSTDEPDDDVPF